MKLTKHIVRPGALGALALALGGLAAGCQQGGGGYTADQRDPIGPAPANIASPGIGAPGGQSIDTRGTGTISGSEGDASLASDPGPLTPAPVGAR